MNTTIQNYTSLCPNQPDSPLSIASSWIGIVTLITTTLGGLNIFYGFYKAFEKAERDSLEYAKIGSALADDLIDDLSVIAPILGHPPERTVLMPPTNSISEMRQLIASLNAAIDLRASRLSLLRAVIQFYKFGQNTEFTEQMKQIERVAQKLRTFKMNLILRRLEKQDKFLSKLAGALGVDVDVDVA